MYEAPGGTQVDGSIRLDILITEPLTPMGFPMCRIHRMGVSSPVHVIRLRQ